MFSNGSSSCLPDRIGCKITLVAFVQLFPAVRFHMGPQIDCLIRRIATLVALFDFSPLCIFKYVASIVAQDDAKPHNGSSNGLPDAFV